MNFNDLYKKMAEFDAPATKVAQPVEEVIAEDAVDPVVQLRRDLGLDLFTESAVAECGDMPVMGGMGMSDMGAPKQQDNVSMNVSLNGSGAGGIKDLMAILKGIEDAGEEEVAISVGGADMGDLENAFDEEYANAPQEQVAPVDAVLPTGDDLHGQGGEAPKVNGGGNPMQEALKTQLSRLYTEVLEGKKDDFDALKHVKNPTKGEKDAAKDVKRGSYADRAAMLKSAEKDGRLKD